MTKILNFQIDGDRSSDTVSVTLSGAEDAKISAKQLIDDLMNVGMDPPQDRGQRNYNNQSTRRSSSKSPSFRSSNYSPQRGSNSSSKNYDRNSDDRYQSHGSRDDSRRFDSGNYHNSRRSDSNNYQSSQRQYERPKSPESNQTSQQDSKDPNEIDFANFDWSKANELYVSCHNYSVYYIFSFNLLLFNYFIKKMYFFYNRFKGTK